MGNKQYIYYVSYMTGIKSNFYTMICPMKKKITTKEDVDELRKVISRQTHSAFVNIIAFSFLSDKIIEEYAKDT